MWDLDVHSTWINVAVPHDYYSAKECEKLSELHLFSLSLRITQLNGHTRHAELYNKMWIWFDLICKWQIDIQVCQYAYNMLFLHNACNVCARERKSFITNEKKIVISKLARLDAPDFMSNECARVVVMWCESKKSNNQRIRTEGDAIGHLLNIICCQRTYKSSFINCAVCQLVFLLSFFCFIELSYILFFDNTNMWVRAVFSSSFSSAFYFFSSRVFRWTLRIFQLREKAHNFSFILSSHSTVVIVVAAIFFCLLIESLAPHIWFTHIDTRRMWVILLLLWLNSWWIIVV